MTSCVTCGEALRYELARGWVHQDGALFRGGENRHAALPVSLPGTDGKAPYADDSPHLLAAALTSVVLRLLSVHGRDVTRIMLGIGDRAKDGMGPEIDALLTRIVEHEWEHMPEEVRA